MVMQIHFQNISIPAFPNLEWSSKQIIHGTTEDGVKIIYTLF